MIKVGILGTGFGMYHAEIYKRIDGYEVVALYGRDEKKLKEIGEKLHIRTTTDMDEIIHHPDIDVVDICLPTPLHAEWAIKALKNKKHVFCETPVTYRLEEALEMKKVAEEHRRHIFVDLSLRRIN
ncbi:Gfo/Idh/MocA family oxidoreductase [Bacillus sp. FSL W7-1360]